MDKILDALLDTIKLMPFLFISFIIMEYLEHRLNSRKKLESIGKYGPIAGGLLGLVPQCGFSVLGATLYSARVITLGTLFAIFLSTSDEMIPIMIANHTEISVMLKLLFTKFILGVSFGLLVDIFYKRKLSNNINDICDSEHCHCKDGLIKSSLIHTFKISSFILIINIILNLIIDVDIIRDIVNSSKIISPIISSIVGLIPNCASSVVITELYLENILSFGSCISGLLTGSGLGLLILFKQNKNLKENIIILLVLVVFSSICGIILNLI